MHILQTLSTVGCPIFPFPSVIFSRSSWLIRRRQRRVRKNMIGLFGHPGFLEHKCLLSVFKLVLIEMEGMASWGCTSSISTSALYLLWVLLNPHAVWAHCNSVVLGHQDAIAILNIKVYLFLDINTHMLYLFSLLHSPMGLHSQNISSKINLLRISRW